MKWQFCLEVSNVYWYWLSFLYIALFQPIAMGSREFEDVVKILHSSYLEPSSVANFNYKRASLIHSELLEKEVSTYRLSSMNMMQVKQFLKVLPSSCDVYTKPNTSNHTFQFLRCLCVRPCWSLKNHDFQICSGCVYKITVSLFKISLGNFWFLADITYMEQLMCWSCPT